MKMKEFFKCILIIIVYLIGYTSIGLVFLMNKNEWYCLRFQILSLLILIPSILWWKDYFDKLFDNK